MPQAAPEGTGCATRIGSGARPPASRPVRALRRIELYAAELGIAACSTWCTKCLASTPSNMYGSFHAFYRIMLAAFSTEGTCTTLIGTASALLTAGLLMAACGDRTGISILARVAGLAIAGFFFVVLGMSWLIGNPDLLASVPMLLLGLCGWAVLLRGPALPEKGP